MSRVNLWLLAAVLAIAVLPLVLPVPQGIAEPFTGADDQAAAAISASRPDYRPWFAPLWEPPSGEIESLLFALQAALGAGLLGYYLGQRRGQSQRRSAGAEAPQLDPQAQLPGAQEVQVRPR
ncbi:energy-coupling factor ABC transporter substrate-binding protein [uncultured Thiodictyon sp.]|uniref:energy-coupling factor ABC transporter substrate-binding protein n=1 Tax=uncultured Thiodictyon sp. TaxID=1846217 RepID=UPI0025E6DA63|nr:energy-coupling factor ABC transporter substrate-binding protein [uncultured Thiodictyon sp.]